MKFLKRFLLLVLVVVTIAVFINYPKLNIISGYSAKSMASSVFVANRTVAFTDSTDNNFSPINIALDEVDTTSKTAFASTLGLLTRKAVYREGLGTVLITDDYDESTEVLKPKRSFVSKDMPYPYGNRPQKDTMFSNVSYSDLNKVVENHFVPENKSRAVLVLYKDQIIAEKYGEGFDKDSRILGWSMTKSVLSTVFGVMEYQGKIDVQSKAPIEAWKNDERSAITIHNLLQMNSGLEWVEDYNTISDVTKMLFLEKDMTQSQVNKELVGKPNKTWSYSSGTTNLLSGILRTQLGNHQEYLDFWYREFIDKIGMHSMLIETDMAGNYVGSSYAWATARDWAKFGLLYLHHGNWKGDQIFSPDWVKYATTPTPTSDGQYGAQLWLNAYGAMPDVPKNMFYADGYQGQRVYVLPDQDLVIVRFGLKNFDENEFLSNIIKSIQPN